MHTRDVLVVLGVLVCVFAIVKGAAAERWSGIFLLGSWGISLIAQISRGSAIPDIEFVGRVTVCSDILLACGFLWLALRFISMWLAAAMMLQSMQLALYGSFIGSGNARHNEYAVASNLESILLLMLIFGATVASWRARVRAPRDQLDTLPA